MLPRRSCRPHRSLLHSYAKGVYRGCREYTHDYSGSLRDGKRRESESVQLPLSAIETVVHLVLASGSSSKTPECLVLERLGMPEMMDMDTGK